ncbi:MAG: ATP-binding protein [Ignavibacteria bacterium]
MKTKFLLTVMLFIIATMTLTNNLLAKDEIKTVIYKIRTGEGEIPKEKWDNFQVKTDETVTFFYMVEGKKINPQKFLYKIFYDGKLIKSSFAHDMDSSVTIEKIAGGNHVIKIQAYNDKNMDVLPVISAIYAGTVPLKKNNAATQEPVQAGDKLSNIVLYSLTGVTLALILAIVILVVRRIFRSGKHSGSNAEKDVKIVRYESKLIKENEELRNENDLLRNYNELNIEFGDLKHTHELLKKEYNSLKETSSFLKNQISGLKLNIVDLENANAQLAIQKEKLLETKRQLEELQIQKDELFAIAVHDIKNPAAAIRSYVELLNSYDLNAQEQQEVMQSLINTSSQIIKLAQQMSMVVAQTKPEPAVKLAVASIKAVADSICNRNMGYALKKNIKLANQTSPNTPETLMDVSKIEEVMDNLVNNAIKYAPKGTVVQVKSFFSGSKITVEVIDSGVGLSPEDCKKAFIKGQLLASEPTDGEVRSGLGLWIAKKIVEDHEGRIWVKSKLGSGSTFGFELPIKK